MRYHRKSLAKCGPKHGFRARQRTAKVQELHSHKRREGRCCNIKRSFS